MAQREIHGPTAEQAHAAAFDRAWDRAGEVRAAIERSVRVMAADAARGELPSVDLLEQVTRLRQELRVLSEVAGVNFAARR